MKLKKKKYKRPAFFFFFCYFALAISFLFPSFSYAAFSGNPFSSADPNGLSPFWNWKTIETDKFKITFPDDLSDTAQKTARYFEEAHSLLAPLLQWTPIHKTQVLLIDNLDAANGLTSAFARFGIVIWATPPDYWVGTHYYDDWLRLVIIHEYTHLLNMDTTESFWHPLRYIFGDIFLPNSAWPVWMLEGLAVYMETRLTSAGRGRSPYYEMILRAAVEEGVLDSPEFMTLDKLTGDNPYFPGGDAQYSFGYQLINEVSRRHGAQIPGLISKSSGARIPFFINGNLENLTGNTWLGIWQDFLESTRTRVQSELAKIKSQPTTQFKPLLSQEHSIGNDATGIAASPDGKWLAFTLLSSDRRQGLYLMNRKTLKTKRLMDKNLGIGIQFTPNSKALIFSRIHQSGQYHRLTDLEVMHLGNEKTYWLSYDQRIRDPHLSPDGKQLTFTVTESAITGVGVADLLHEDGRYKLGPVRKIFWPKLYDRVGNPHFSSDGNSIYFTYHPNGKSQEDLMQLQLQTGLARPLVSNGAYNRFPITDSTGNLYFVSDLTGVDNLYRFDPNSGRSTLATNMTTGISYPAFAGNVLYADVFGVNGWGLSEVELLSKEIATASVALPKPPAPQPEPPKLIEQSETAYPVSSYNPFPSLLPRIWSPLLGIDATGVAIGAQLFGFDAINTHRYLASGAYNTTFQTTDWNLLYSNRSFGPDIQLKGDWSSVFVQKFTDGAAYWREVQLSSSVSYPFLWTFSSLTPSVAFNLSQYTQYITGTDYSQSLAIATSPWVPSVDGTLTYSSLETSRLAVVPEGGRYAEAGARVYLNGNQTAYKVFLQEQEFFRLAKHTILNPSVRAAWTSRTSSTYAASSVFLEGRTLGTLVNPFPGDGFRQLTIRGYPNIISIPSRAVGVAAMDLYVPLARIFRGVETNPIFFDNLYALAFIEGSFLSTPQSIASGNGVVLPAAGTGLRLSTELFRLPITFSAEFHYGFREESGGTGDFFFQIIGSPISF